MALTTPAKNRTPLIFRPWTLPLALLALLGAAFGLLIPWLGLYWDDWAQLLSNHLYGFGAYWRYFASDRPLSAWTHILFAPILGGAPLHWQLFTLGLRWLTAWAMFGAFSALWPQARRPLAFASLLFAVYPAFTQQPVAVSYHQHWTQYLLFFISLGAMIRAARQPQRFWPYTLLALVTLLLHLSITEFFIGVEMLRPLFLWLALGTAYQQFGPRLKATLRLFAPYAVVLLVYVVWRLKFAFPSGGDLHPPELLVTLLHQPLAALSQLWRFVLMDELYILVTNWSKVLDLRLLDSTQPIILASYALTVVVAAATAFYLSRLKDSEPQPGAEQRRWLWQALAVGALVTLLGPAPTWVTGNQLVNTVDFHNDRFALVAMFGASLLYVAALEWLGRSQTQKAILLAVLIGLAAGFHLRTANDYRWMWTYQTRFYWQLSWRAPDITPGTALISEEPLLPNQELFSSSAAINLLYPQPKNPDTLAYWMYTLKPKYSQGVPDQIDYYTHLRIYTFTGGTPNSLLLQYDPSQASCLWVLSPDDDYNPDLSDLTRSALRFSNLERIGPEPRSPGYPPTDLFGPEPEHDWCYFFQKADLGRQLADWAQVAALGDEARRQGYEPNVPASNAAFEWLPFIEGYARSGRWSDAQEITQAIVTRDSKYGDMLCRVWGRFDTWMDAEGEGYAAQQQVFTQLGCR